MRELGEAAGEIEIRRPQVLLGRVQRQRVAIIRLYYGIQRFGLQGLPALHGRRKAEGAVVPPVAGLGQHALAGQHDLGCCRNLRRQVGKVSAVGNFLHIHVGVPAAAQILRVPH